MLHAHGGFNLPTNVPANEFLNLEGNKISTSRNHAIWLHEYLKEFPDKTDELRYVINSILPETKDADFTWKDYQAKVNNELVAILGNFVNRVIILTHKYFNGKIPDGNLDSLPDFSAKITAALDQFNQRQGLEAFMEIARYGNKYLQDTAPWKLIKDDDNQQSVANCILTCLHIVHQIGLFGQIFLPDTSHKILKNLNLKSYEDKITTGHNIGESKLLFEKVEDDVIEWQITKLNQNTPTNTISQEQINQPLKPMIQYDDFVKLDIRVATITAAEKVKKTDRLLHITLDIGTETRDVVSGIAEHFAPEDIIGKQVTYLANLAPRTLKGIESNGMILMAENEDGSLRFVSPDEQTKPGSIIS
jgi:methionyl-tRNA synthetase